MAADRAKGSPLRIRGRLLASLRPENYGRLMLGWSVALLLATVFLFWSLIWPSSGEINGDPQAQVGSLSRDDKKLLAKPTGVEIKHLGELNLIASPLFVAPPPPQTAPALPADQLFGVTPPRAAAFNRMTQNLKEAGLECRRFIATSQASGATPPPAGAASAAAEMPDVSQGATANRGVFQYHQGLIDLCGPDAAGAKAQFKQALDSYAGYVRQRGGRERLSRTNRVRLAQYEMLTHYGYALASLADGAPPETVDAMLVKAWEAARDLRIYDPPGPFVELERDGCAGGAGPCDLFVFSTAEIANARLAVWLKAKRPVEGYRRLRDELGGAPTYLARHPRLAANFAAAAAAAGDLEAVRRLYGLVRLNLQANPASVWLTEDSQALAHLTALAVAAPGVVYEDGDDAWWPVDPERSSTRARFLRQDYGADSYWFPAIQLSDPSDEAAIDQWLWLRRGRSLLETESFVLFREDGATIATLGPGDRDFLEDWRREVTRGLGERLLKRAETIREKEGLRAAAPLLQLLSGREFPWDVRAQAKLSLAGDAPGVVVAGRNLLMLLGLLVLAMIHFNLNIGYGRAFTRRHYLQRLAREAAHADPGLVGAA